MAWDKNGGLVEDSKRGAARRRKALSLGPLESKTTTQEPDRKKEATPHDQVAWCCCGCFLVLFGKFISHEPIHEPIQRSSLGEVGLMKVPLHNQRPNDVSSSHSLASTQKEEKVVACSKALFAPSVRDISLAAAMDGWSMLEPSLRLHTYIWCVLIQWWLERPR